MSTPLQAAIGQYLVWRNRHDSSPSNLMYFALTAAIHAIPAPDLAQLGQSWNPNVPGGTTQAIDNVRLALLVAMLGSYPPAALPPALPAGVIVSVPPDFTECEALRRHGAKSVDRYVESFRKRSLWDRLLQAVGL